MNLIILSLFITLISVGQEPANWKEITLIDTIEYTGFSHSSSDLAKYPPSQLFDGSYKSCWVAGASSDKKNPVVYVRMPKETQSLNLYPGYGKSKSLYYQNARPREIRLSIYAGINPEGYVSEIATIYKSQKFEKQQVVSLADTPKIQHIELEFSTQKLTEFLEKTRESYKSLEDIPVGDVSLILAMEITEIYPGTKYKDICISELFFNNRLVTNETYNQPPIEKVYITENEHSVLIDTEDEKAEAVFTDTSAIIQLVEVSSGKRWATIITMPVDFEGRMETHYNLLDLPNKILLNDMLARVTQRYIPGSEIFLRQDINGSQYVIFYDNDFNECTVELK